MLIKAQIWQESKFDPEAKSSHAMGLMQLLPATAREMGLDIQEIFDPEKNISAGVKYDRVQYDHFPEISPSPRPSPARGEGNLFNERLKFMLAAYNCGRGYINKALRLAKELEFGYQPLSARPGQWQTWEYTCTFLSVPLCEVNGKHSDYKQVWNYVEKIWEKYLEYQNAESIAHSVEGKWI